MTMNRAINSIKPPRSDEDPARMVVSVAKAPKLTVSFFMLGDSLSVLEGSKQLVPNPFQGHDKANRMLTNPDINDAKGHAVTCCYVVEPDADEDARETARQWIPKTIRLTNIEGKVNMRLPEGK